MSRGGARRMSRRLIAVFADAGAATRALRALEALGVADATVVSPFPLAHRGHRPGPERFLGWLVFGGGVAGLTTAIALQAGTSLVHPFVVGGKPVLAWPAFGVVMFELTLLFAGVVNFAGLAVLGAHGRRSFPAAARRALASDRLALVVPVDSSVTDREAAVRGALAEALEVVA